jgi:hypothetical protein
MAGEVTGAAAPPARPSPGRWIDADRGHSTHAPTFPVTIGLFTHETIATGRDTMISTVERFWIAFILRFAIGFLFLFAGLKIFSEGPQKFSEQLSGGFASTWIADIEIEAGSDEAGQPRVITGVDMAKYFLLGLPYVLTALSVPILTGIFLRPSLRLGAVLLVILGLGKYLQNDVATTAADFLFALIICIGLYFLSLDRRPIEARLVA